MIAQGHSKILHEFREIHDTLLELYKVFRDLITMFGVKKLYFSTKWVLHLTNQVKVCSFLFFVIYYWLMHYFF